MNPRRVGFMSLQSRLTSPSRGQRTHGERARDQRSPSEPQEAAPRLVGRVEPRCQYGGERQGSVGVVEALRGAPVVREQQQSEADLRHEQRLDERQQVAEDPPGRTAPPGREGSPRRRDERNHDERYGEPGVRGEHCADTNFRKETILDEETVEIVGNPGYSPGRGPTPVGRQNNSLEES